MRIFGMNMADKCAKLVAQLSVATVSYSRHMSICPYCLSLRPATVSRLGLTSARALTGNINTDIEMECSVLQETSLSSRYAVTWLLQKEDGNKTLISSDQDALVTFGPQLEPIDRQRIGASRSKGPVFKLFIRHAQISDGGSYVCEVVEWLQGPQSHWYPLPPLSRTILLMLSEPGMFNYISADSSIALQPE